jgi:hypothetical protein
MMYRHFIAGALACLGSNLFGQSNDSPASPARNTLNNIQNSVQNGLQSAQDALDRSGLSNAGTAPLRDNQNRATLNGQSQLNTQVQADGLSGSSTTNLQGNTNLQATRDGQSGQFNANLPSQTQGQAQLNPQQRANNLPQNANNAYPLNNNSGFPSQGVQGQNQTWQGAQGYQQGMQSGSSPYNGTMQNGGMNQWGNSTQPMYGQNSWSPQSGRVYMLRHDRFGREYICVDGYMVYVQNTTTNSVQGTQQGQYRSGYGNYDMQNLNNGGAHRNPSYQPGAGYGQNQGVDQNGSRTDGAFQSQDQLNRGTNSQNADTGFNSPNSNRSSNYNNSSDNSPRGTNGDQDRSNGDRSDANRSRDNATQNEPPRS